MLSTGGIDFTYQLGMNCLHSREFSFFFFFISWRLITLQYCSGFCHTLKWISHGFTCVPHLDPPSHLPLHPIPLGLPSAPGPSTCLMHPTWAGDLFHPRQYTCFDAVLIGRVMFKLFYMVLFSCFLKLHVHYFDFGYWWPDSVFSCFLIFFSKNIHISYIYYNLKYWIKYAFKMYTSMHTYVCVYICIYACVYVYKGICILAHNMQMTEHYILILPSLFSGP